MISRKRTRPVKVGPLFVGGGNPVRVQSMTTTPTVDVTRTVRQILKLQDAGCEIVRCSVPDKASARALSRIKRRIDIPLVADIHFDHLLAIEAIRNGADKIRINPGNIGSMEKVGLVLREARRSRIPVRVGVNAGSLRISGKGALRARSSSSRMVQAALEHVSFFEKQNFRDIILSLKASNVPETIRAYREISEQVSYPLHLGITEAGPVLSGTAKSAVGIGILLNEGIGDTVRVSLTGDPVYEVRAAYAILRALEIRSYGPEIISCPTCGRCGFELPRIVKKVEEELLKPSNASLLHGMKIAIMGCIVNGPGEAREADIGIAGGRSEGLLFRKGVKVRKVGKRDWVRVIVKEALRARKS